LGKGARDGQTGLKRHAKFSKWERKGSKARMRNERGERERQGGDGTQRFWICPGNPGRGNKETLGGRKRRERIRKAVARPGDFPGADVNETVTKEIERSVFQRKAGQHNEIASLIWRQT